MGIPARENNRWVFLPFLNGEVRTGIPNRHLPVAILILESTIIGADVCAMIPSSKVKEEVGQIEEKGQRRIGAAKSSLGV